MQLVRTAQPKHKINLLSLSTEAGGPDVGHLVCSINSMQFVRTAQFKHKHLLLLLLFKERTHLDLLVVVVSHIQRIGCQPEKNYFTRWPIPLVVC